MQCHGAIGPKSRHVSSGESHPCELWPFPPAGPGSPSQRGVVCGRDLSYKLRLTLQCRHSLGAAGGEASDSASMRNESKNFCLWAKTRWMPRSRANPGRWLTCSALFIFIIVSTAAAAVGSK